MFTGLIEEVGAISRRSGADITVMAETVLEGMREGDSIAVNGACLTALGRFGEAETLLLSSYENLAARRGPNHRRTQKALEHLIELYDITQDLAEQKNVAADHPDIIADMARIMKAEHRDRKKK